MKPYLLLCMHLDTFIHWCGSTVSWQYNELFVKDEKVSDKNAEVGIYKRKIIRKKEIKYASDQEKSKIQQNKKENKISTKKKQVLRSYFFAFINSHSSI